MEEELKKIDEEKEKEKKKSKGKTEKAKIRSFATGIKSLCIYVPRLDLMGTINCASILKTFFERSKLLKFIDHGDDEMESNVMSEVVRCGSVSCVCENEFSPENESLS